MHESPKGEHDTEKKLGAIPLDAHKGLAEAFVTRHRVAAEETGVTWNLDPEEEGESLRRGRELYPDNRVPKKVTAKHLAAGHGVTIALFDQRGKAYYLFEIAQGSDGGLGTILEARARRKNR